MYILLARSNNTNFAIVLAVYEFIIDYELF